MSEAPDEVLSRAIYDQIIASGLPAGLAINAAVNAMALAIATGLEDIEGTKVAGVIARDFPTLVSRLRRAYGRRLFRFPNDGADAVRFALLEAQKRDDR